MTPLPPLSKIMKHEIPGHPPKHGAEKYECKGDLRGMCCSPEPSNTYHPAQKAWLMERNLYTGRMIVDIAHLPENLKFLTL
jgi:hypothetical protein